MSKGKLEQVSAACHHLGFFNNAGLSAHYKLSESSSPAVADLRGLVYAAAGDLLRKHRILFAIPVNEGTPNPHFACLPWIDLRRSIAFLERSVPLASAAEEQDKELDAILEEQHNIDFQTDYGTLPFWRLIILRSKGRNDFTASFIYHHAIGDGVSGLAFHKAFCNALEAASSSTLPTDRAENIIRPDENTVVLPPLEELHPMPISPRQPPLPTASPKEWTGASIHLPCKSRWASLYISPSASNAFVQECKEMKLSVTSALSSVVAAVLFDNLPSRVEALTSTPSACASHGPSSAPRIQVRWVYGVELGKSPDQSMPTSAMSRRLASRTRPLQPSRPSPMCLPSSVLRSENPAMRRSRSRMWDSSRRPQFAGLLAGKQGTCCSAAVLLYPGLRSLLVSSPVGMGLWRLVSAGRRVLSRMASCTGSDRGCGSTLRSINRSQRQ